MRVLLEKLRLNRLRKRFLFACLFIIMIGGFLIFSPYGIITNYKLFNKKKEIKKELIQMKNINDSLKNGIKKLKFDSIEIERIAREKYGMIKKGEKVFLKRKIKD